MKYIYLHGFASSPASRKAQFFAGKLRELGLVVEVPHLESEGFLHLTVTHSMPACIRKWRGCCCLPLPLALRSGGNFALAKS
jgi:hypothetical protein